VAAYPLPKAAGATGKQLGSAYAPRNSMKKRWLSEHMKYGDKDHGMGTSEQDDPDGAGGMPSPMNLYTHH